MSALTEAQPRLRIAVEGCVSSHPHLTESTLWLHLHCLHMMLILSDQGHGTLHSIYASVEESCRVKGWNGVDVLIIGGDFQVSPTYPVPSAHQVSFVARRSGTSLTSMSQQCQQNTAEWPIFMNITMEHEELLT